MENSADRLEDADNTNATAITFDNLTILKEFGNIANLVRFVFEYFYSISYCSVNVLL